MPDPSDSIFNRKATERLRSPDDLDKIVQVANPSLVAIVGAVLALLIGLSSWVFFGTNATTINTKAVRMGDRMLCFLDTKQSSTIATGDVASIEGYPLTVNDVATYPLSRQEATALLDNDYLASTLVNSDWCYQVGLTGSDIREFAENVPLSIIISTDEITPMEHFLHGLTFLN